MQTPPAKKETLSIDEKLDKLMEAVVFQHHLLLGAIKAMDDILAKTNSKIIKPL